MTFCIDRAGLVGEDGVTHHGLFDIAYLRPIPGIVIASPRDGDSLRDLLYTASLYNGPMAIRYPRGTSETPGSDRKPQALEIGRGVKLADGNDVTFISTGPIASEVTKAIARLQQDGISATHYDMTFIKPIDKELLNEAVKKKSPIITIEDGTIVGGLGSAVEEFLQANDCRDIAVKKIGVPDEFVAQGSVSQLRKLCGMDAESIVETAKSFV